MTVGGGNGEGKIDRGKVEKMAIQAGYRWPRLFEEAGVTEDFFRTDKKLSALAAALASSEFFNPDGTAPLMDLAMRAGVEWPWIAAEFRASFSHVDQARGWVERLAEAEAEFRLRGDVEKVFRERSGRGVMEALADVLARHQAGGSPGSAAAGPRTLQSLVQRYVDDRMESLATGKSSAVSTGFPTLDRYFKGGWRRKEVTVLMAGAGVGKTTFADHLRRSLAQRGFASILFSAEMSEEQLAERQAHASAAIPLDEELDMDDLREASRRVREDQSWTSLMEIDETPEITPGRVIAKARARLAAGSPLALLVLDTLGKVRIRELRSKNKSDEPQGGQEYDVLSRALFAMKPVAKALGLPLLVIHHLREGATDPTLNDAHGCKHVGREADNAISIWRKDRETWARILKARQTRGVERIDFQLFYDNRTQHYIESR